MSHLFDDMFPREQLLALADPKLVILAAYSKNVQEFDVELQNVFIDFLIQKLDVRWLQFKTVL